MACAKSALSYELSEFHNVIAFSWVLPPSITAPLAWWVSKCDLYRCKWLIGRAGIGNSLKMRLENGIGWWGDGGTPTGLAVG